MVRAIFTTIALIVLSVSTVAASPQEEALNQRLAGLLPRSARWGVTVVELEGGREIARAGNVAELLIPASLVKLFVGGAALERVHAGQPLSLDTEILHDGSLEDGTINGNVYLRGNGNCLLSEADLQKAAERLRQKGIARVSGGVVADDIWFDRKGLERSRKGAGYAPVSALGMELHTVRVVVTPSMAGKPLRAYATPSNPYGRLAVTALASGGKSKLEMVRIDDTSYRISGNLPADSDSRSRRFELHDPALYTAQSFAGMLSDAGIKVEKGVFRGRTPTGATPLENIPAPEMDRFVREMNLNSLNVAADNLLLALGREDAEIGTAEKGVAALRGHLARHGLSGQTAIVVDGSGLNPANRITARGMAHYLASAVKQPWFLQLLNSLPRAGMEGTLRNSGFKNERFRAKSGNLEGVTALAGYGVDNSGRKVAFAFIANSPDPLPPNARLAGDEVMRWLAEQR